MTVKPIQEIHRKFEISKDFSLPEMDREIGIGGGSWEEWLKSVGKKGNNNNDSNKIGFVHSQVLRIREEDSHLGEDIVDGLILISSNSSSTTPTAGVGVAAKDDQRIFVNSIRQQQQLRRVASAVTDHVVFFSRPILPCSPLSGKTTVKALPN